MEIGKKIATARKNAGMTQTELAEIIGVYQKDISRWERNELKPNIEYFAQICKALNISADEILEITIR